MPVNHPAGRAVAIAHTAAVAPDSLLGSLSLETQPQRRSPRTGRLPPPAHQLQPPPGARHPRRRPPRHRALPAGRRHRGRRRRPGHRRRQRPFRPRPPVAPRAQLRLQPHLQSHLRPLRHRSSRLEAPPSPHLRRLTQKLPSAEIVISEIAILRNCHPSPKAADLLLSLFLPLLVLFRSPILLSS